MRALCKLIAIIAIAVMFYWAVAALIAATYVGAFYAR